MIIFPRIPRAALTAEDSMPLLHALLYSNEQKTQAGPRPNNVFFTAFLSFLSAFFSGRILFVFGLQTERSMIRYRIVKGYQGGAPSAKWEARKNTAEWQD